MKSYIWFEIRNFLKNSKTFFMLLLLLTFLATIFYGIQQQGLGDQKRKLDEELNQTHVLSQYTQQYNEENKEEFALSQNLSEQKRILASQANGLTFDNQKWYLNSGLELANLRLQMHESESFSELPASLLPREDEVYRDLVELEAIQEKSIPIVDHSKSTAGFVKETIFIFGFLAFAYILIFASDLLIEDFAHGTMFESYPITSLQKYVSKLIIYTIGIVSTTLITFILSTVIVSFIWGVGNFNYPIGFYLLGQFKTFSISKISILFIFYYFLLTIHTILLAMLFNQYLKNGLATIIVGLILFILPYLYQPLAGVFRLLPFYYYNITALVSGQFGMEIGRAMDVRGGSFILLIYSVLLGYLVYRKEKSQTIV